MKRLVAGVSSVAAMYCVAAHHLAVIACVLALAASAQVRAAAGTGSNFTQAAPEHFYEGSVRAAPRIRALATLAGLHQLRLPSTDMC
jgi:hypothetical protein